MKKIITIALAAALFLALAPAVSAQDAEYAVNAAAETIVIDGTVEAGEWGAHRRGQGYGLYGYSGYVAAPAPDFYPCPV